LRGPPPRGLATITAIGPRVCWRPFDKRPFPASARARDQHAPGPNSVDLAPTSQTIVPQLSIPNTSAYTAWSALEFSGEAAAASFATPRDIAHEINPKAICPGLGRIATPLTARGRADMRGLGRARFERVEIAEPFGDTQQRLEHPSLDCLKTKVAPSSPRMTPFSVAPVAPPRNGTGLSSP
jgi:hypothetical protein